MSKQYPKFKATIVQAAPLYLDLDAKVKKYGNITKNNLMLANLFSKINKNFNLMVEILDFFMVRITGFEPAQCYPLEPESSASAIPPLPLDN